MRTLSAAFIILAVASIWPLTRIWSNPNPSSHSVILVVAIIEFAAVAAAMHLSLLAASGKAISALLAVGTLALWALLPETLALMLLAYEFAAPTVLIVAVPLLLVVAARRLIMLGRLITGAAALFLPLSLVAAIALYRPAAPGSIAWPVAGSWYAALAVAVAAAAAWDLYQHGQGSGGSAPANVMNLR